MKLEIGTILIPKPEHAHRFSKNKEYVVTQDDTVNNPTLGEYWMVKPDKKKKTKCKESPNGEHKYIPPPDSFDLPYCKYCYKT